MTACGWVGLTDSADVQQRTMSPHGEQTGYVVAFDHDQVPEPAPDHRLGGFIQRPLGRGIGEVFGAVLRGEFGVRVLACGYRVEDVTFGQDADARVLRVDHHGGSDAACRHHAGGLSQSVCRPDGKD